jgi:hypothetical protein
MGSAAVRGQSAINPARAVAAQTKLPLEGPILSTLLRLAAPSVVTLLAIASMSVVGFNEVAKAADLRTCRPTLAFADVQFSSLRPDTLTRRWSAIVSVDSSRCAKDSEGTFEIAFSRAKENATEIEFRERVFWDTPVVAVDVDFWADESVERFWFGRIAPCSCASEDVRPSGDSVARREE